MRNGALLIERQPRRRGESDDAGSIHCVENAEGRLITSIRQGWPPRRSAFHPSGGDVKRGLIILGTSGLAREMAQVVEAVNERLERWECLGFIGEPGTKAGTTLGGARILGDDEWALSNVPEADVVVGIGYPKIRERALSRYLGLRDRFRFPNLVHPAATVDLKRVRLGEGNVLTAGCILTCDIEIDSFNLFNLHVTVGHDARIGRSNVLNPSANVSGNVQIGDRVLVGTGAQILEGLRIADDATIGAGAVVVKPVPPGSTVVGVPAKALDVRRHEP